MKRDKDMKSYAVEELKAMRKDSRTDWSKADAVSDKRTGRAHCGG